MDIVAFFGAEPSRDGKSLGQETMERLRRISLEVQRRPDLHIIFESDMDGFAKKNLYARLVKTFLKQQGIPDEKIKIVEATGYTTLNEIDAIESFLKTHREYRKVWCGSSWYHTPRIQFFWWLRYRRKTKALPVWMFSPYILKRALLEPLKIGITLACLSPRIQRRLAESGRKRHVI